MWPPTQEVPKLLSASNWKYVTGEVLLNKTVYCYSLRGLIYSLRVLAIEYLSRKHGGAMPSAHSLASQECSALAWVTSACHGPWGRSAQMKKGHDQGTQDTPFMQSLPVMCWTPTVTIAHLHGGCPSWHNCLLRQQEWTFPVGQIKLTILFRMFKYYGSHVLLTFLQYIGAWRDVS